MRCSAVLLCAVLSWAVVVSPCEAGVSKDIAKQAVKEFNENPRAVRPDHLMLPVNYVEVDGQPYAYYVPRRMKRLTDDGAVFTIRKLKTKKQHVVLELETEAGARLDVLLYDNQKLTQPFMDEVVPLMMSTLFEFGVIEAGPRFVGNQASNLLHLASCNHLPDLAERLEFEQVDEAATAGYRPCPVCFSDELILPLENYSNVRLEAIEDARLFELVFPVVEDPTVQERLQVVGEKVLANFPLDLVGFDYEFTVVHSSIPQAAAFATGFVFVTDSLLDMVEHEMELEFVIAHEIAHCELSLPPVGDPDPSDYMPETGGYEYYATWIRHRETVSDLLAVQYLHQVTDSPDIVARARNILAKLQFIHEAVPVLETGKYETHPTFTSRLELFQTNRFEIAAAHEPLEIYPLDKKSLFEIRVIGKSRDEDHTFVYLLIEGTDLVNKEWKIQNSRDLAKLVDGQGKSFSLRSSELYHKIDAGDVEVVKAEVGSFSKFGKLDLQSGPLKIKKQSTRDAW